MARIRKVSDRIATYGCLNVQQYSHVVSVVGVIVSVILLKQ